MPTQFASLAQLGGFLDSEVVQDIFAVTFQIFRAHLEEMDVNNSQGISNRLGGLLMGTTTAL
jgi:hypothetical protein